MHTVRAPLSVDYILCYSVFCCFFRRVSSAYYHLLHHLSAVEFSFQHIHTFGQ